MEFPALTSRPNSWIQSMSWPSWLDCRNTSSSSSLSASDWHIFSTSASDVRPYTSGLRVPSRLRLGPLSTSTDVMVVSGRVKRGRPDRRESARPPWTGGTRSDRSFLAHAVVLGAGDLRRVLLAKVVQVHPVGLPGRP